MNIPACGKSRNRRCSTGLTGRKYLKLVRVLKVLRVFKVLRVLKVVGGMFCNDSNVLYFCMILILMPYII